MEFTNIPVKKLKVLDEQSRQDFNEERLQQLASSIKEVGQLQPVIVKRQDDGYLLIAGERRLRAIKKNGKNNKIAAIVLDEDLNSNNIQQIRLIENLQRQDLNPLERAKSIQQFIDRNDLTKKAAAKKLGVPRTTLTEWLNILEVKPHYQQAVLDENSSLTLSHISLAKALSSRTGDPSKLNNLLEGIIKYNLTREETKEIVNLFHKYLHISMEEAFATILIKRERKSVAETKKHTNKKQGKSVKKLLRSFDRVSEHLEEVMEEVGVFEEEEREELLDEFLYIYQMLEIMIPEFKEKSVEEFITEIKRERR